MFVYLRNQRNLCPKKHPRGTVLILCVALLVILGMVASSFVILSHAQRASSRSLTRADQIEQVRQMSLEYIRTRLLEDLVGNDGIFLNGGLPPGNGEADEAYDAPGTDGWLSSHNTQSNTKDVDTDGDGNKETSWNNMVGPFSTIGPDGTKYQVAVRIVDTNGLANVNVGTANIGGTWPESNRRLWDSQYPSYLYLRDLGANSSLDNGQGSVAGRIKGSANFTSLNEDLYPYLANLDPPTSVNYIRPFDVAEELALRMKAGVGTDLNGRLNSFTTNSEFLTAYSWTMQIRPPAANSAVDTALTTLGFPAPCKIPLNNLVGADGLTVDVNTCKAVYLVLVDTGMTANAAAQFLVNLIDYIDNDIIPNRTSDISVIGPAATPDSVIDFGNWTPPAGVSAPGGTYYGTEIQPIISEVYCQRVYKVEEPPVNNADGTFTFTYIVDDTRSRYAVELYNPSGKEITLVDWKIDIGGAVYEINSFTTSDGTRVIEGETGDRADYFLTLMSSQPSGKDFNLPGKMGWKLGWKITVPKAGAEITIKLINPAGVVVDHFLNCNFKADPPDTTGSAPVSPLPIIMEDFQRKGNDVDGDLIPAIVKFEEYESDENDPAVPLDDFPTEAISPAGEGGQIIVKNRELHSLGELLYIPTITNTTTSPALIEAMEGQSDGDSSYRLNMTPVDSIDRKILQYLTLRTGIKDLDSDGNAIDNDGDGLNDNILEARVPGLINIKTAPVDVLKALHYYYDPVGAADQIKKAGDFVSIGAFASYCSLYTKDSGWPSKDEGDPDDANVGSPDGITVDNEEKMFHFTNVANLISVRSDVFVVYITIQASDRDGVFQPDERIMRTMAIVDRSFCLKPTGTEIPLPRIVAQTILP